MRKRRTVIGLTGGIASGKSTVARMFAAKGVPVIDTDVLARTIFDDATVQDEVLEVFGPQSIKDGHINREYVASIIFSDEMKRIKLNEIMHPKIKEMLLRQLAEIDIDVVVEVPLLYETDFYTLMDKIIVVYVDEVVQKERLMERDGLSEDEASARIKTQMPLSVKAERADYVLDNTHTLDDLAASFEKLYEALIVDEDERRKRDAASDKS